MQKTWVLLFCLAAAPGRGQTQAPPVTDIAPPPSSRFPASWYPQDNDVTHTGAPQRGAPYAGTLVTTWQLRDSGGTTKTQSQSAFQARDGAGRKRDETPMPRPDGHGGVIMAHEVSVNDPVSHCSFRWMEPWVAEGQPTAIVTCMPRTLHYVQLNIYADEISKDSHTYPGVNDRSESLGTRMIDGLATKGVRHTRTQTDAQSGKTTVVVTEVWYSPELQELMELRQTLGSGAPPAASLPDYKLTQIHRGEPDEKLFYPPDGYKIQPGN